MSEGSNVTTLYHSNFRDIPASLRVVAEQISAGEYDTVTGAALVLYGTDGAQPCVAVFGMGEHSSDIETVGILACGQQFLTGRPVVR